jgi:hypothetical protein
MSTSIDNAFVKQFERDVHDAFQRQGSKLMNTVRTKMNVEGSSTTFQRIGTGVATTKARHGAITPMNQTHTAIECTLADFYAGDWVDKLDELKINIDERGAVARGGAWALGRKVDDQILDSLDGTSQTVVTWVLTSAAAVRNSLIDMVEALNSNDVPDDGDRYAVLTPKAWAHASTVEEWSSSDYVSAEDRPFAARMQMKEWMGIKWMQHSGTPGVGTATAKVFAYHKSAVGYASGQGIMSDITWHGDRASHFVNNMMSGGACLIEDNGVIEGNLDDTAALATS